MKIGIIGDYDGRPSHLATQEAIKHCSAKLGIHQESYWLPTTDLEQGVGDKLLEFDGLWCAPGSPYQSMWGAIHAIQYARENKIPFLGTCGGFQHAALEFAKNVLQLDELMNRDFNPYLPNIFIAALSCSLMAQSRHISIDRNSRLYQIYERIEIEEKYNCDFGLNKDFQKILEQHSFKVSGVDEDGEARILTLESSGFYIATLFQPQLSSSCDKPHPLILSFLTSALEYNRSR
jgi:CTP synthase (UTP-ammonia lyase)